MKKYSGEVKQLQKIAGLIKENIYTDSGDLDAAFEEVSLLNLEQFANLLDSMADTFEKGQFDSTKLVSLLRQAAAASLEASREI